MKCEHCNKDIENYYFERDDGQVIYCMDCGYTILTESVYGFYDYEETGIDLDEEAFDDDLSDVAFYIIKMKGEKNNGI